MYTTHLYAYSSIQYVVHTRIKRRGPKGRIWSSIKKLAFFYCNGPLKQPKAQKDRTFLGHCHSYIVTYHNLYYVHNLCNSTKVHIFYEYRPNYSRLSAVFLDTARDQNKSKQSRYVFLDKKYVFLHKKILQWQQKFMKAGMLSKTEITGLKVLSLPEE